MPLRSIAEQDEAAEKKFRSALLSLSEHAGRACKRIKRWTSKTASSILKLEVYNSQQLLGQ